MADREDTRARAEPPLRTTPDGESVHHVGSRAQLLAAGIVGPDTPFPGDRGQRKTYVKFEDELRRIRGIWTSSRGRYRVTVRRTDDDLADYRARIAIEDARWRERQERVWESQRASDRLKRAPASFEQYRKQYAEGGMLLLNAVSTAIGRVDGGYRYAQEVVDAVAIHVQAIENLFATGTIEFDGAAREAERARLHAVAARGDCRFDSFMRKAKARS